MQTQRLLHMNRCKYGHSAHEYMQVNVQTYYSAVPLKAVSRKWITGDENTTENSKAKHDAGDITTKWNFVYHSSVSLQKKYTPVSLCVSVVVCHCALLNY